MNNYGNLIKSNVISFNDALINNFKLLELDETDIVVLIHLNNLLKESNGVLNLEELNSKLTIDLSILSKRIMKYIQFEYVEISENDKHEQVYSLDGLLNELGNILEGNDKKIISDSELIRKVINYIEVTYQKELKQSDLDYVSDWVENKYSYDEIKEAILVSVRMNKMNLNYVDRILINSDKNNGSVLVNDKTKEILKGINVRK